MILSLHVVQTLASGDIYPVLQNLVATRLATLRDFVLSVAVRRGPATSSEAARATDAKRNGAIGGAGESDDGDNDSV